MNNQEQNAMKVVRMSKDPVNAIIVSQQCNVSVHVACNNLFNLFKMGHLKRKKLPARTTTGIVKKMWHYEINKATENKATENKTTEQTPESVIDYYTAIALAAEAQYTKLEPWLVAARAKKQAEEATEKLANLVEELAKIGVSLPDDILTSLPEFHV